MNPVASKKRLPRALENGHILLWLVKDTCWALEWKWFAGFMIIPTAGMAFYLLWQSRSIRGDSAHNLAICCWITANSIWMMGELNGSDTRLYAIILFLAGLTVLLLYYLFIFRKEKHRYEYVLIDKGEDPLNDSLA